mmetsp:Transcript_36086/g.88300  ORF Transcript_36086/g.88300 Transcript_36086/m.88300 type:complete len:227 (+) Transcript_36086:36-716(+)
MARRSATVKSMKSLQHTRTQLGRTQSSTSYALELLAASERQCAILEAECAEVSAQTASLDKLKSQLQQQAQAEHESAATFCDNAKHGLLATDRAVRANEMKGDDAKREAQRWQEKLQEAEVQIEFLEGEITKLFHSHYKAYMESQQAAEERAQVQKQLRDVQNMNQGLQEQLEATRIKCNEKTRDTLMGCRPHNRDYIQAVADRERISASVPRTSFVPRSRVRPRD